VAEEKAFNARLGGTATERDFVGRMEALKLPRDKPVVVLCHSGSRSSLASQLLLKAGRPLVANLRGGLSRWSAEGYPVEGVHRA
jgi:rhodanese-related sulfurtransferase